MWLRLKVYTKYDLLNMTFEHVCLSPCLMRFSSTCRDKEAGRGGQGRRAGGHRRKNRHSPLGGLPLERNNSILVLREFHPPPSIILGPPRVPRPSPRKSGRSAPQGRIAVSFRVSVVSFGARSAPRGAHGAATVFAVCSRAPCRPPFPASDLRLTARRCAGISWATYILGIIEDVV